MCYSGDVVAVEEDNIVMESSSSLKDRVVGKLEVEKNGRKEVCREEGALYISVPTMAFNYGQLNNSLRRTPHSGGGGCECGESFCTSSSAGGGYSVTSTLWTQL